MTGLLLSRFAHACACSASWRRWASPLYHASAVAERYEQQIWQAPAFLLAWTCIFAAVPFAMIAMTLWWLAAMLMPQREPEGEPLNLEDIDA